jgi:predicted alpha/beta-hydrolase family hydrolase
MASSPKSRSDDPARTVRNLTIAVDDQHRVSGLLSIPEGSRACLVLAHGAGAGMNHPFLAGIAAALAEQAVAALRFQFPYMEEGRRRPDPPPLAHAAIRAAVAEAKRQTSGLPLFAGGKSFGGRMTSEAEALQPLGVGGLVFLGFPLHPAGRPGDARARHLAGVGIPMLFLQGTRDQLADLDLLRPVIKRLRSRARLDVIEGADHSFHVPSGHGIDHAAMSRSLAATIGAWIDQRLGLRSARTQRMAS